MMRTTTAQTEQERNWWSVQMMSQKNETGRSPFRDCDLIWPELGACHERKIAE